MTPKHNFDDPYCVNVLAQYQDGPDRLCVNCGEGEIGSLWSICNIDLSWRKKLDGCVARRTQQSGLRAAWVFEEPCPFKRLSISNANVRLI